MEALTLLFAFTVLVTLALVLVAVRWARSGRARILIIGLFAVLLPAGFIGPASLLGKAKPVSLEWFQTEVEEAEVLSAQVVEGDGIYLTLVWDRIPYLYKLPWNLKVAQQLQDAMRQGEDNGTKTRMRRPFEPSLDDQQPLFYAPPQEARPAKQAPGRGTQFQRPGAES
ncbi:MAG: hypothetical protein ACE5JS_08115 [Nitrospinota bacterium]